MLMKQIRLTLAVLLLIPLTIACGQQGIGPQDGLNKNIQSIDTENKLGGSEVTNPYLRKVSGNIVTDNNECPYDTASAVSKNTGHIYEVTITDHCFFEAELVGGDSYAFDFVSGDDVSGLVFSNGDTYVYIEPVKEDKNLGTFNFFTDFKTYEDQVEDFVDNVKKVNGSGGFKPGPKSIDFNVPELKGNKQEDIKIFLNEQSAPKQSDKLNIDVNLAPKKPDFSNQ